MQSRSCAAPRNSPTSLGRIEPLLAMARPSVWPIFCLETEWNKGKPNTAKAVTKGEMRPLPRSAGSGSTPA
ncbi:hypothetical protein MASR2M17_23480 [Aminivibrio sp.]